MPCITYDPEPDRKSTTIVPALMHAESEVRRLMGVLTLIAATDQSAGGSFTEAECWRQARHLALKAIKGGDIRGDTTREQVWVLQEKLRERDAMLCGVLSSIHFLDGYLDAHIKIEGKTMLFSDAVREYFNEDEAGITWEQAMEWWTDHQEQDRVRREQEALEIARKREAALAKLTPEERTLLGI
jgi:hypothetical protein